MSVSLPYISSTSSCMLQLLGLRTRFFLPPHYPYHRTRFSASNHDVQRTHASKVVLVFGSAERTRPPRRPRGVEVNGDQHRKEGSRSGRRRHEDGDDFEVLHEIVGLFAMVGRRSQKYEERYEVSMDRQRKAGVSTSCVGSLALLRQSGR